MTKYSLQVRRGALLLFSLAAALGACATKRDVDAVRSELASLRARQDTIARTVAQLERSIGEALDEQRSVVISVRGDVLRQLDDMERQLVTIQELLGQSQIVLRGLRERGEQRQAERSEFEPAMEPDTARAAPPVSEPTPAAGGARSLYSAAVEQFRRGAYNTARTGFQEFLVNYPGDELAPDAQYYLAETYGAEGQAQQAIREYNRVVELYPNSRTAPTALYKAGLLQAERGNKDTACQYFQRVLAGYPRSDESRLARDQTERLNCR